MRVTFHVTSGSRPGRRLDVRGGQVAQFGSTEWADFCFPGDGIAEVHFSVESADRCRLTPLQHDFETAVNGTPITDSTILHSGDVITFGDTALRVEIEGERAIVKSPDDDPGGSDETAEAPEVDVVKVCQYLELDGDVCEMAEATKAEAELVEKLRGESLFLPAIRLQAHLLPKPVAVRWGVDTVERTPGNQLDAEQQAALESAKNWAADPTEENRRRCETAAEAAGNSGPGGALASAAFWSGGSLAPATAAEEVPPDERLTGQTVAIALTLAAVQNGSADVEQRYAEFLDAGIAMADNDATD